LRQKVQAKPDIPGNYPHWAKPSPLTADFFMNLAQYFSGENVLRQSAWRSSEWRALLVSGRDV